MVSSSQIRPAAKSDLPRIMEIEGLCFTKQWQHHQFEAALKDIFFVYEDRQVWGFLVACSCELARRAVVMRIAVHPEARGLGIASQLIQTAIAEFTGLNLRCAELDVDIVKNGAIKLYERFGFKMMKLVTLNHNNDENSFYIMKLILPSD
jgi:ribosomal-protein-alanine N-acetyltransferase